MMKEISFLLALIFIVGCAGNLYKVEQDSKGREHCRNTNTGVYVNMVNCQ